MMAGGPFLAARVPGDDGRGRARLAGCGLLCLLAGGAYFWGLDGQHIPRNGDECPYEHITRLTAQSGHLLPLAAELPSLADTKPPLLFWQGLASTHGGRVWTLWNLRYPSVLYTFLTALLVFALAARLSGHPETGLLGALAFLAFFSTYRYGRPFLTNPPEVFWLSLPFFTLLHARPRSFESRLLFPILGGCAIGMALLYKSFALALPAGLGLALWYWHYRGGRSRDFLARDAGKIALSTAVALALFGGWFLIDPDPGAIWREFVLRENLGKLPASAGSYLAQLLWGTSSLWSLALAYPLNAGLLAFPTVALFVQAYRGRRELGEAQCLLWIWVLTLFVFYSLPSQRSGRYLLPAMPALAVLLALGWERIPRRAFAASLLATVTVVLGIAYLSSRLQEGVPGGGSLFPFWHWLFLGATLGLVLLGLLRPSYTRGAVLPGALLSFFCLASLLRPLDGPLGRYPPALQRNLEGQEVWVPYDFIAGDERYQFLLPGARLRGYRDDPGLAAGELLARYPRVAVFLPLEDAVPGEAAVLGERLDLKGRQGPRELREIFRGRLYPHLFRRELLLERRSPATSLPSATSAPKP